MTNKQRDAGRQFFQSARARSGDNVDAMSVLIRNQNYRNAIGMLRQEIDTFVRLVFLDTVDPATGMDLIEQFARGEKWRLRSGGKTRTITDRVMVDAAKKRYFWTEVVYDFGCALIHLSKLHDYRSVDPFTKIGEDDRRMIARFLHDYHGYQDDDIDLARFVELLPKVMKKISDKVLDYSATLEMRFFS